MNLTIGNSYRFNFTVGGKVLTYTGKIIDLNEMFITILDIFGKTISYNINTIVNYEEVDNGRK